MSQEEVIVTLPKLGESILNATVVKWLKKEGDIVEKDEALLEVATDKVNSEIPSPITGTVKTILASVDQLVDIDQPLAVIITDIAITSTVKIDKIEEDTKLDNRPHNTSDFFSPAVLHLAKQEGISLEEMQNIPRSSHRLSKKDVTKYLSSKKNHSNNDTHTRIPMTGMRKLIADNMTRSFYEAPHASLITEVDVTDIMEMIKNKKEEFLGKYKSKLSVTSFVAQAITCAIKKYPLINSSLEGDTIVIKEYVNLGLAVNVDQGLQVPVIKNCHDKKLHEIASNIATIAKKARDNTLSPDEIVGGSITLTNFGMTGVMTGIPIIRYPEVAIIGTGAIKKKVTVMEDGTTAIRSIMNVSLTFDHRVLDGIYGCGFLNTVKTYMEKEAKID
jgi:2-oxoglutarate dehydrogenase E2 component (dihydrolipoamide succinyltransferase)